MSSPEHKQKIWNLISEINVGMLTTWDDGVLRSRPMQLVQEAYDGTLWFFTDAQSAKVDEVQQDRDVGISFADPSTGVYVSLSGTGRINNDPELIKKFWSDQVAVWFPEGDGDKNCALLEVKIHHGEHWKKTAGPVRSFVEHKKAQWFGGTPNISTNEQF